MTNINPVRLYTLAHHDMRHLPLAVVALLLVVSAACNSTTYPSSGDPPDCATAGLKNELRDFMEYPGQAEFQEPWIVRGGSYGAGFYGLVIQFHYPSASGVLAEYEAVGRIDRTDCTVSLVDIHDLVTWRRIYP